MTELIFPSLDELRQRESAKWRLSPPDCLPMTIAEMDVLPAAPIREMLIRSIQTGDLGYNQPHNDYQASFAQFAQRRWGWDSSEGTFAMVPDVGVGLANCVRELIRPGDGVIINSPIYGPFYGIVAEGGGTLVDVPLAGDLEQGWSLDIAGIDAAFAQGAKVLMLSHPHNPVGAIFSPEELAELARVAVKHDAVVLSDEIHAPMIYEGERFTPFLSVSDDARKVGVSMGSASKPWNIPGLKCAHVIAVDPALSAVVEKMGSMFWRPGLLGMKAAIVAYREGEPWLDELMRAMDTNRKLLRDLLAKDLPHVGYRIPDATYLAWLDFRAYGWSESAAAVIEEKSRVSLSAGEAYAPQDAGWARLNFGCSPEVLGQAVSQIAAGIG